MPTKKPVEFPDLSAWGIQVTTLIGLSRPWQKFFAKLPEVDVLPPEQWKEFHLLSYFLKRFYQKYSFACALSFKGSPLNCMEIGILRKLTAMLNASNGSAVKDYIDWVYDNKIDQKFVIQKVSFLLLTGLQNQFLGQKKKKQEITRSTPLPEVYANLATNIGIPIETYGDLLLMIQMINSGEELDESFKDFYKQLEAYCFNFDSLKEIK